MKFRSEPGSVFDRVFYRNETIIVEKSGEPRAVILPMRDYEEIQRRKREAKARLLDMIQEVRTRVAQTGISETDLQSIIDEAVEAVRHETTSHPSTQ